MYDIRGKFVQTKDLLEVFWHILRKIVNFPNLYNYVDFAIVLLYYLNTYFGL